MVIDRFCYGLAGGWTVVTVLSQWMVWKSDAILPTGDSFGFKKFQINYLAVFFLAMLADWMQGAYVYALYEQYGYSSKDIGILFVVGFGTSAVCGPIIGVLADSWGRKKMCLVFSLLYALSCMTKHSSNFGILLLGRLLAGASTSILFSVFDAWMVHEHHQRQFPGQWLGQTFNRSTFGNGIVAILAGVVAAYVGKEYGKVAPFDVAAVVLMVGGGLVFFTWTENFGEKIHSESLKSVNQQVRVLQSVIQGCKTIVASRNILLCGILQSFFEGAMYTFVFQWTPALPKQLNHGLVFTCYMIAMMAGSAVPAMVSLSNQKLLGLNCLMSGAFLAIPIFLADPYMRILGFAAFEYCCGIYFASYYTLRSQIVPDSSRATINNIFRIPLNIIVVSFCLCNDSFSDAGVFTLCSTLLFCAAAVTFAMDPVKPEAAKTNSTPTTDEVQLTIIA